METYGWSVVVDVLLFSPHNPVRNIIWRMEMLLSFATEYFIIFILYYYQDEGFVKRKSAQNCFLFPLRDLDSLRLNTLSG